MMPRITSADLLVAVVIVAILAAAALAYLAATAPGDPFPDDTPRPAGVDGLGERPAEIATGPCPFPPAPRPATLSEETTQTSPAPSPARAPRAPAPGDEAAGGTPPSPPPPPQDDIATLARIAIDTPSNVPFPVWQIDEFVEAYNARQNGSA